MIDSVYTNALGWTLIHSIWQLTILALVFYLVMLAWKHRKPGQRYRISLLFMLISLSVTCLTFIVMYAKFSSLPSGTTAWAMTSPAMMGSMDPYASPGWWESIVRYLQTHVTSMTYLYMGSLALLMLRMGINLWSLNRLKSRASTIDPGQLGFLKELMEKMNMGNTVSIRSSVQVKMPMVIGAFQPVILIPASLLSNTPPHILKAMIAHELAHVERYDFAVNLIQSLVETFFFYHPAVWYFSYMARREREYACDQRAIGAGCRREDLVRALTEVGELQHSPALSMSLGGSSNELLNRVKYLLGLKPTYRYIPDQSIWYYGSLMGVFLLFSIGKQQFFPAETHAEPPSPVLIYADTLPDRSGEDKEVIVIRRRDSLVLDRMGHDSAQTIVRIDTLIRIIGSDTLPVKPGSMTIISGPNRKIIVDGNVSAVRDSHKLKILQDSLHAFSIRMENSLPDLDSLMGVLSIGMENGARTITAHQFHLDSLQQRMSIFQSDMETFDLHFPDSFPHPAIDLDSLWSHIEFSKSFHGRVPLDSLLLQWNGDAFKFFIDSSFARSSMPFVMGDMFYGHFPQSPELQELSKEIQAKTRELGELKREQREQYWEQRGKYRQEQQKFRDQEQKYRQLEQKFREQKQKYHELQQKYQDQLEKLQDEKQDSGRK